MTFTAGLVAIISFAITFISVSAYKKINLQKKFCLGKDINKKNEPALPEGTGITLLAGIVLASAAGFFFRGQNPQALMVAVIAGFFGFAGFFDDLKNKFEKRTVGWAMRAVPIALFSFIAGYSITGDFLQAVIAGIFISVLASFQNTFAGLNGWEVGSGLIISVCLAFLLFDSFLFFPAIGLSASILALFLFNKFPAQVFPGDAGTLLIGSSIAAIALLSGQPKTILLTALFFLPHALDFLLKLSTNRSDMTQQKTRPYLLLANGKLDIPDRKKPKLDFAKLLIKIFGPMEEKKIVTIILATVSLNCLFWTILFS